MTPEERTDLLNRIAKAKGELLEMAIKERLMRERREQLEEELEGLEQRLEK